MRIFTWLSGFLVLVFLVAGFGLMADQQASALRVDTGGTFIVSAFMIMIVATLVYHQTNGGTEPARTLGRSAMYVLFNAALLCLVIGEILFRQVEFERLGGDPSSWALAVGVPVYDSLFGYVIFVIPINFVVLLLLKNYVPHARLDSVRRDLPNRWRLNKLRLLGRGVLLFAATLGLGASLIESDFTYVPSMVLAWVFCFMLFVGAGKTQAK